MIRFDLPLYVPAALFALAAWLWWLTQRRIRRLEDLPEPAVGGTLASVCLCMPARNEAEEIGAALDSWLAQDHPDLRIVVVDDGSTDGTSETLAARAEARPDRVRVIRNDSLPAGWLGKNHALHLATKWIAEHASHAKRGSTGSESSDPETRAEGQNDSPSETAERVSNLDLPWAGFDPEWLLFADADVRAEPRLLRRALAYLERRPADLLALCPAIDLGSWSEALFLPPGSMGFLWLVPPDRVADPRSGFFCGIGAFTLVRRSAYDAIGGHAAAPMEAVDDMMLARRAKAAGFANRVAMGGPGLRLRMYHGLADIVRSMRKNALSFPWVWGLAPVWIAVLLLLFASPLLLALGGWPGAGLLLWLLWPAMVAEARQRSGPFPVEPVWMLWPLVGPILAVGLAWAFWDRLRGVNHWRGREVKLGA